MSTIRKRTFRPVAAIGALLLLVAAACGGEAGSTTTTTAAAATTTTAAGGDSTTTTEAVESVSFAIVTGAPGSNQVLTMEALDRLNQKYGHQGEFLDIADSEIAVQGVADGQFQLGTGTASTTMLAMQIGAPMLFIGEEIRNPWVLAAKNEIQSCADMDGRRFGLHSPGGVSTALYDAWYNANCDPSIEPNILFVAGSPNRVQGLLEDQLDVTMLLVHDTFALPSDDFHIMARFSTELPDVKTGLYYGNEEFLREHRQVVVQFLTEVVLVQREVQDNPELLEQLILKFLPERQATAALEAASAVELQLFPPDAGYSGLSPQSLQASIDTYVAAEVLEPGLDPNGILDLSFLEEALEAAG